MIRLIYILLILLFYWLFASTIFFLLGSYNFPFVWAVLGLQFVLSTLAVLKLDPDLLAERAHPRGKDSDPHGRLIITLLFLLHYFIACWDLGHAHWSDKVPPILQLIALVPAAIGWAGFLWAMQVNKFFSSAIRLQEDRGQHVISSGPYALVRHPGYAFASLAFIFNAVAFGSWISILPQILLILYLAHRTELEEALLKEKLPGYTEYMLRVRFRWIPGIW